MIRDLISDMLDIVEGKALPVGTKRTWGGKDYVKGHDGKWNPVSKGGAPTATKATAPAGEPAEKHTVIHPTTHQPVQVTVPPSDTTGREPVPEPPKAEPPKEVEPELPYQLQHMKHTKEQGRVASKVAAHIKGIKGAQVSFGSALGGMSVTVQAGKARDEYRVHDNGHVMFHRRSNHPADYSVHPDDAKLLDRARRGIEDADPTRTPRAQPKRTGKVKADSVSRYRGPGGQTRTRFRVFHADDARTPEGWDEIEGHGATPAERKADAIRKFKEKREAEKAEKGEATMSSKNDLLEDFRRMAGIVSVSSPPATGRDLFVPSERPEAFVAEEDDEECDDEDEEGEDDEDKKDEDLAEAHQVGDKVKIHQGPHKGHTGKVTHIASGPRGNQISVDLDHPVQRMLGPAIIDPSHAKKVNEAAPGWRRPPARKESPSTLAIRRAQAKHRQDRGGEPTEEVEEPTPTPPPMVLKKLRLRGADPRRNLPKVSEAVSASDDEMKVLRFLIKNGGSASPFDLGDGVAADMRSIDRAVSALARKGLIKGQKSADGLLNIAITPGGRSQVTSTEDMGEQQAEPKPGSGERFKLAQQAHLRAVKAAKAAKAAGKRRG